MKIKLGIPSIGDRRAGHGTEYMHTSFLLSTNNKALMKQLYVTRNETVYFSERADQDYTNSPTTNGPGTIDHEKMRKYGINQMSPELRMDSSGRLYMTKPYYVTRNLNTFGEREINVPRVIGIGQSHKEDPLLHEVAKTVEQQLFPPNAKRYNLHGVDQKNFRTFISWKFDDGEASMTIQRKKASFYVEHVKMLKKDAIFAVAKVLMRSVYCRSAEILENYIEKVTSTPHNVLYAIENRSPYHFYDMARKVEVMINTKSISLDEVAVEISEDIWAGVSTKEWNQFLNVFRHGAKRNKRWLGITPENLWIELFTEDRTKDADGEYVNPAIPTSGQLKMMLAWLRQNRTSAMVEDRATQLLRSLDAEYPNLTFINWPGVEDQALHVRGPVRDWVITGRGGMKVGHQNVSTYCIESSEKSDGSRLKLRGRELSHSICIDNLHNNSSVGDQIAARAMVLLNDTASAPRIYTITNKVLDGHGNPRTNQPRIPPAELNAIRYVHQDKRRQKKREAEEKKALEAKEAEKAAYDAELDREAQERARVQARLDRRRRRRARRMAQRNAT